MQLFFFLFSYSFFFLYDLSPSSLLSPTRMQLSLTSELLGEKMTSFFSLDFFCMQLSLTSELLGTGAFAKARLAAKEPY
jgi:hypothetical protein